MLDYLITLAMRQRAAVLLATFILIGIGSWSAIHLPIDAVPDITNPQVQINTAVPALAPEEIEKLVTLPLESQQMTELAPCRNSAYRRSRWSSTTMWTFT